MMCSVSGSVWTVGNQSRLRAALIDTIFRTYRDADCCNVFDNRPNSAVSKTPGCLVPARELFVNSQFPHQNRCLAASSWFVVILWRFVFEHTPEQVFFTIDLKRNTRCKRTSSTRDQVRRFSNCARVSRDILWLRRPGSDVAASVCCWKRRLILSWSDWVRVCVSEAKNSWAFLAHSAVFHLRHAVVNCIWSVLVAASHLIPEAPPFHCRAKQYQCWDDCKTMPQLAF